jgi:hypothetical protein
MPLRRFLQTPPADPTRDYDVVNKQYIQDAVDNEHTHSNQDELDKVTTGDHDAVVTGNPHSVTASDVGLGDGLTQDVEVRNAADDGTTVLRFVNGVLTAVDPE